MLGRTAILGLSSNQSTDPFTVKLAKQNLNQRLPKCIRFVYRLSCLLHVLVIIKWRLSFVMTQI